MACNDSVLTEAYSVLNATVPCKVVKYQQSPKKLVTVIVNYTDLSHYYAHHLNIPERKERLLAV